ncbi:ferritin-like domain-containing protein [Sphingobacterium sp. LRF_L2]|uniref:ferritin-like domain-containing protein n=1 Tax=Sphingobacterium sp. LRF_L2 TaxID=3369421 RepID=UPI003F5F1211
MGNLGAIRELVDINNDRIAGFQKAIDDLSEENSDLKGIFEQYRNQSQYFSQELNALIALQGEDKEKGNTFGGTLHRAWIDVKSLFVTNDRVSILNEVERGEDAIKAAYKIVLDNGEVDAEILSTVMNQALEIRTAHDDIKALRDKARANVS